MAQITIFLLKAVAVSLSGVMAPGAITAATVAQGTRRPFAGALISLGHGIVEFPLILLLVLGLSFIFKLPAIQVTIGLLGGTFLLWMAAGMLRQVTPAKNTQPKNRGAQATGTQATGSATEFQTGPVLTGVLLSATNPYFLLWWATVGLNLAIDAKHLGPIALVLFAVIHWLCDLVWLSILSFVSFHAGKGNSLLSRHFQKWTLSLCGIVLFGFGVYFIYEAAKMIFSS